MTKTPGPPVGALRQACQHPAEHSSSGRLVDTSILVRACRTHRRLTVQAGKALAAEREERGRMRGLYAHASPRMRDDLKQALEERWNESLQARAALSPHSPVPLLDSLLDPKAGRWEEMTPKFLPSGPNASPSRTG
jgi:hypothetical protein